MIAAIISGLLGAFTAGIPKAFELFEKKMTFAQEMKIREFEAKTRADEHAMQLKMQTVAAQGKVDEGYYEAVAAENTAFHENIAEHMATISKPTGYAFIDLMNALVRPLTAFFLLAMLAVGLVSWFFGVGTVNNAFGAQLGALFVTSFEFVFGFYFGARAVTKPHALLSFR